METITLISGREKVVCSNPVYYARIGSAQSERVTPSHIVAWPQDMSALGEISYVQLKDSRVPILVARQKDGSVWLGGAYLDVIAGELRLIPRPVPAEMSGKSKEWLEAVDGRWQIPGDPSVNTPGSTPAPGWDGNMDEKERKPPSRPSAGEE
jgi:hypothetical protein